MALIHENIRLTNTNEMKLHVPNSVATYIKLQIYLLQQRMHPRSSYRRIRVTTQEYETW